MRTVTLFNNDWSFVKKDLPYADVAKEAGISVELPHTWNNLDGADGGNDYIRAAFWYFKRYNFNKSENEEVYLEFQGVSQIAEVYLNGKLLKRNECGFSTFTVNLTSTLIDGENLIAVRADNSPNRITYPQNADFTFFGGIYRDVSLITVPKTHFDLDFFGSDGVFVTPVLNKDGDAEVEIKTLISNPTEGQKIELCVSDTDGKEVYSTVQAISQSVLNFKLFAPTLWNGRKNPYLYTATVKIVGGKDVLDEKKIKFGVRSFAIDPEKGFILNGESYPLRGVSRHQDRKDMGWAITNKEHEEDVKLIYEMGANSIRLAHYQHNRYFYELCDELGIITWTEIPYISSHMDSGEENTYAQMQALIYQNYNHPSIVVWGLSNEISISGIITEKLLENHKKLNELCHSIDKTRLTTMAQLLALDIASPLNNISDVIAYNLYLGWYVGTVGENAPFFDRFHAKYPNKAIGLSEYGAEAVLKWHTSTPKVGDYTEEYQAYYHEKMLEMLENRKFIWCSYVWNMFDFGSDMRDEGGSKGTNNKGLVTYDRKTKKDSYFIYKAHLSDEPFVHVCGKRYVNRAEEVTKVKVYSNLDTVSLYVNERKIAEKRGKYVFEFDVPLNLGENVIKAESGKLFDESRIVRVSEIDKSYVLENNLPVMNWFDESGNEHLFTYPEGFYSVRDKVGDIVSVPEGAKIFDIFLNFAKDKKTDNPNADMPLESIKNITLERLSKAARDILPLDMLYKMNVELNKIKKPN